jgi:hypothetical protein
LAQITWLRIDHPASVSATTSCCGPSSRDFGCALAGVVAVAVADVDPHRAAWFQDACRLVADEPADEDQSHGICLQLGMIDLRWRTVISTSSDGDNLAVLAFAGISQ